MTDLEQLLNCVREERLLIITDVRPELDDVLRPAWQEVYIIRCPELFIWDSYGSLVRSILQLVYTAHINKIVVLGTETKEAMQDWPLAIQQTGISERCVETVKYMLQHVHGCDPQAWFHGGDVQDNVRNTVSLLQGHPLLPRYVSISGFIWNEENSRLHEVGVSVERRS